MSETPQLPDLPPEGDEKLELLLRKLEPSHLDCRLTDRLHREYRVCAREPGPVDTRPRWDRAALLTLACCLVVFSYIAFHYGPDLKPVASAAAKSWTPAEVGTPSPAVSPLSNGHFLPASSSEIDSGLSRETVPGIDPLSVEAPFFDYQHPDTGLDPDRGTHFRFFRHDPDN